MSEGERSESTPATPTAFSVRLGTLMVIALPSLCALVSLPGFLSWRHSQVVAGVAGALLLLILRLLAPNERQRGSGSAPLALAMTALIGSVGVALVSGHPEGWNAASVTLILAAMVAWIWYPPRGFDPYPTTVRAIGLVVVLTVATVVLDAVGVQPFSPVPGLMDPSAPPRGSFSHSDTTRAVLLCGALLSATIAVRRPHHTTVFGLLAATAAVTLFLLQPPLSPIATISLTSLVALGALVRAFGGAPATDPRVPEISKRRRWIGSTAVLLFAGGLIAMSYVNPERPWDRATLVVDEGDPLVRPWLSADPFPRAQAADFDGASLRAALRNLPFGRGGGTWLDATLMEMRHLEVSNESALLRLEPWPDMPRSLLSAAVIEHGILALFIWLLLVFGAVVVIRDSARIWHVPLPLAITVGALPAWLALCIPGASHPLLLLLALLSWFILASPAGGPDRSEMRGFFPSVADKGEERRPPRGRIIVLLIPALIVAYFTYEQAVSSREGARAYAARMAGDEETTLDAFTDANRHFPRFDTLYNEAVLRSQRTPLSERDRLRIELLLEQANEQRPLSALTEP